MIQFQGTSFTAGRFAALRMVLAAPLLAALLVGAPARAAHMDPADDEGAGEQSTLIQADAGSARVAGFDVTSQRSEVRRRISLTGQYAALDESLTGQANLVMVGQLSRLTGRQAKQRAAELLARFDLSDAADRGVKTCPVRGSSIPTWSPACLCYKVPASGSAKRGSH